VLSRFFYFIFLRSRFKQTRGLLKKQKFCFFYHFGLFYPHKLVPCLLLFLFFSPLFALSVVLAMVFRVIGKVRRWEQNKMAIDCLYLSFTNKTFARSWSGVLFFSFFFRYDFVGGGAKYVGGARSFFFFLHIYYGSPSIKKDGSMDRTIEGEMKPLGSRDIYISYINQPRASPPQWVRLHWVII